MVQLSDIQEIIERSIFEKLRAELILRGYLPDITTFTDDVAGYNNYHQAIQNISDDKGFAIELFNQSPNLDKGVKKVPRIVIVTSSSLPGALGGTPGKYFLNKGGNLFEARATPPQSVDIYVNIHLVSNSVEQYRILNSILALAIPRRGYINWYDNEETGDNNTFFCRYINQYDSDNLPKGITEKIYAYEIPDCFDRTTEVLGEAKAINDISLETVLSRRAGVDHNTGSTTVSMVTTTE